MRNKIAFLDYSCIFSGAEASLHTLIRNIDRDKYEVTLIFPFPMSHHYRYMDLGIDLIYLSEGIKWWMGSDRWKRPVRGSDFIKRFIFGIELAAILLKKKIKLLHINLMRPDAFWWIFWPRVAQIKVLAHIRSDFWDWMPSPILQQICSSIICVSEYVKEMVTKEFIHHNIYAIHDPVEISSIPSITKERAKIELGIDLNIRLISSVGLLSVHKGHDMAIEVFSELCKSYNDLILLIAGGGNNLELNRLKYLCIERNVEQKVKFTETQISNISIVYIASEFIFSLSKHGEAFGRVPFEAAALKTPCIGPNCGAILEVLEDGISGIMADPSDLQQILERSNLILSGQNKVSEILIRGKDAVIKKLSPDLLVKEIEEVYDNLLK
jgi:glycosyltransferase involved in cell wall biosynthesis